MPARHLMASTKACGRLAALALVLAKERHLLPEDVDGVLTRAQAHGDHALRPRTEAAER